MKRTIRGAALAAPMLVVAAGTAWAQAPILDAGAAGVYQKMLKLKTTASAMHTTAHPDDENGGVLARVSRGEGARLALLTLNRGESGDNAIGSELFDGLGLIRTEELVAADRWYGVDDQYFTTVVDYGYSKRLDEALDKWGKENVLRDVVRIIRMNRPFVLISRFQGNEKDGHGNHQTAGIVTPEAWKLAADPNAFPEQIREGLRPWQPMKVYIGFWQESEPWNLRIDAGEYSPWLGSSYSDFATTGLSYQRSQTSGLRLALRGPVYGYFKRVGSTVTAPDKEQGFFDGIDTTLPGLFKALGRPTPKGADLALAAINTEVTAAFAAFRVDDPSASVPALARGLAATRTAIVSLASEPEAVFVLQKKEAQFADAITAALGARFSATAQPAGIPDAAGPFAAFMPPPTMAAPVLGAVFEVRAHFANRGKAQVAVQEIVLRTGKGITGEKGQGPESLTLGPNGVASQRFNVRVADDAPLSSRPYFERKSIQDARYILNDPSQIHRPASEPPLVAVARYTVAGVTVETSAVVRRLEARLPYGHEEREVRTVPSIAVTTRPATAVVGLSAPGQDLQIDVDLLNNREGDNEGTVALELPAGWTTDAAKPFRFGRSGEKNSFSFTVKVPKVENRAYEIKAVAKAAGREYREGYEIIEHRDIETRYLYRTATSAVRGVDAKVPAGLKVGYVMGAGDAVPAAIAQLGASVTLLAEKELAAVDLSAYDTIMTGTRAYGSREDLKTYNNRLLDYAKNGGNVVVLYNTPSEFDPKKYAPFPAELPMMAEEVSEEDSPVTILAPEEQVFNWPNKLTSADFEGWVEQRGSKFFRTWDQAYTPMIATHDKGQEPQKGGWVTAPYGKGRYTYFAYAFHRQLPYGVPGAYRLLANVISLGKSPEAAAAGGS